jgi:hypothetical protein
MIWFAIGGSFLYDSGPIGGHMDPRFLPFQIAAGLLLAAAVLWMMRMGIAIYRNNAGVRGLFGGAMFVGGMALGWAVVLAGFGA